MFQAVCVRAVFYAVYVRAVCCKLSVLGLSVVRCLRKTCLLSVGLRLFILGMF